MRSILATVIGFLLWSILWLGSNALLSVLMPGSFQEDGSTDNMLLLLFILVLSVIFSLLAGYVTARMVTSSPVRPVWALGIALLAVGLFVQSQVWSLLPLWYHILFLVLLIPGVLVGARMRGTPQTI